MRDRAMPRHLIRRRVLITLDDESGVEGVLWRSHRAGVELQASPMAPVRVHPARGQVADVDGGHLWVPKERVKFVQVLSEAVG